MSKKTDYEQKLKNTADEVKKVAIDIGQVTVGLGILASEKAKSLIEKRLRDSDKDNQKRAINEEDECRPDEKSGTRKNIESDDLKNAKKTIDADCQREDKKTIIPGDQNGVREAVKLDDRYEARKTVKTDDEQEIKENPKPGNKESEQIDASAILNTVIDGAYSSAAITEKKGVLLVGEKEISRMNCESYEINFDNDIVEETKKKFYEYRKKSINPLNWLFYEKYLMILWRNGEKSVTCLDSAKFAQIVKILS